jgi:hypothetical protein
MNVHLDVTHQILIRKNGSTNETVQQLFTDFKKAYDSVRKKVLYSILIKCGVRLSNVCLNETYSKVCTGNFSLMLPIQNGPKQKDILLQLLFNFALEYVIMKIQITRWD